MQIFSEVVKRGDVPSIEDCDDIALWLNANASPEAAAEEIARNKQTIEHHRRNRDAIMQLRRAIRTHRDEVDPFGIETNILTDLETSLAEAEQVLAPKLNDAWRRKFSPLVFGFAAIALIALRRAGGRATSIGRNTHAAIFTELALKRIGWDVSREDVANLWADWIARPKVGEEPTVAESVSADIEAELQRPFPGPVQLTPKK